MPSMLYLLNFVFLQWFFVRLARVVDDGGITVDWTLLTRVWPLTGWWSPYRYVGPASG